VAAVAFRELDIEVWIKLQSAAFLNMGDDHRSAALARIKLIVPCGVKRVGPKDAFPVAADLDHLRAVAEVLSVRVFGLLDDAADFHLAGQFRVHRVGDVILVHFALAPAGDIQVLVIQAEIDVCDKRGDRAKPGQKRRQIFSISRLRRDCDGLLCFKGPVFVPPPGKDRTFQIGRVDDDAHKTILFDWIMGRADFQRHLMVFAQINRLNVFAAAQIPEVDLVAIFVAEQVFCNDPVLELRRQPPFGGNHIVSRQVPPEIIVLVLDTALDFVPSDNIESLAVHDENTRGAVRAILAAAAEGRDVNPFRSAMDRMRARVTGLLKDFFRLDDLVDLGLERFFDINDVNPARPDAGNDQIAALQERMPCQRGEGGGTGVPAEMVKLVARVGHHDGVQNLSVSL
jgi:hypothetical protein